MNTKKQMKWAIVCMILLILTAHVAAKCSLMTAVNGPTYSPNPPVSNQPVTVNLDYTFDCPLTLSTPAVGSTPYTLDNIKVSYKVGGSGSYQSISVPASMAECTIQCPPTTPPQTCHMSFTTPALPVGVDCKPFFFQMWGEAGVMNLPIAYQSPGVLIALTAAACAPADITDELKPTEAANKAAGIVFDPDQTFRCADLTGDPTPPGFPGCNDDFSCVPNTVTDEEPIVRCKDCNDCKKECAKACGTNTRCFSTPAESCQKCCEDKTCSKGSYIKYEFWTCLSTSKPIEQESCACLNACQGECEANTAFCNVITLMRILALIAAAVLLAIHGLRLIMSEEPEDRKNAKESIWFVILGTLIIVIASALVSYLYVGGVIC